MAERTTILSFKGIYSGTVQSEAYRNASIRYQLTRDTTTEKIPADANIISAYFTISEITIHKNANGSQILCIYEDDDGDISISRNDSNDTVTIKNITALTSTKTYSSVSSNTIKANNKFTVLTNQYDYFKNNDSFYIRLIRTDYTASSTSFWVSNNPNNVAITCTITWNDGEVYEEPNPPTNIRISSSNVTPGENISLSWTKASMPSTATNVLTGYEIYYASSLYNAQNNNWNLIKVIGDATTTGYEFSAPTNEGTYYYTVCAITNLDGHANYPANMYSMGEYAILTVQEKEVAPTIGDISAPETVTHNLGTNYIGTEGLPSSFTIEWSGAQGGENNPISSYTIRTPNNTRYEVESSATYGSKEINETPVAGDYYVTTWGTNSSTGYGTSFTLFNITTPSSPTVYSISTPLSATTFTVQWQSVSSNYSGVSNVRYNLYYRYNNGSWSSTPLVSNITGTSYVLDSSIFTPGQTFYVGVQAQFNATGAGYTRSGISSSNALIYSTSFTIPDPFWKAHYDAANGRAETTEDRIYNSLTLVWNKISDTTNSSYNYNLQQKKGNGAYESIATFNNIVPSTGTGSYTLNNLGGETQLSYQMVITDQYGSNTWSSPEIVINVTKPIEITNLRVDAVDADSITFYFDGQSDLPDTTNYDEVLGDFYLSYGGAEAALARNVSLNFSVTNIQQTYPVSLIGKTSGTDFWGLLYNEVIKNKNPWPTVKLIIRARYEAFSQSVVSSSIDYKANYTTKPNYDNCIITLNRSTYYNPGDTAVATLSGFSWKDAAGGETGADIRNYLSSSISSNQFIFDASTFKTNILIPSSSEDKNVTLTLNTQLTYATGTQTFTSTTTANLTIARWIAEAVTISNVQLTGNTLEGYLVMPERYCGSDTFGNFKEVTPVLSSKTVEGKATFYGYTSVSDTTLKEQSSFNLTTFIKNDADKPRLIKFVYSGVDDFSDVKLYFTTTFYNTTNNNILIIEAVPYRYFTADIDFAIRKGRAGLNVGKDFGVDETNGSTLQVNAWSNTKTDKEAIVEVFTSQESADNIKTIFFALGNAANPDYIYKEGNNIFIDNLYHPPADSLTNGTLTLDFNSTGLVLSGNKGGTILTEKNYSDYFSFNPTGAITTVIDNNLTADCVLISNANGKISVLSTVSSTELGYLNGVTSAIQTQLNNKLGKTETAVAATKLETGRTLKVNLASTSASTVFNGESNITDIGVSGTLAIPNGGTGTTTSGAQYGGALYNLGLVYASSLPTPSYSYYGKVYLVPKG